MRGSSPTRGQRNHDTPKAPRKRCDARGSSLASHATVSPARPPRPRPLGTNFPEPILYEIRGRSHATRMVHGLGRMPSRPFRRRTHRSVLAKQSALPLTVVEQIRCYLSPLSSKSDAISHRCRASQLLSFTVVEQTSYSLSTLPSKPATLSHRCRANQLLSLTAV